MTDNAAGALARRPEIRMMARVRRLILVSLVVLSCCSKSQPIAPSPTPATPVTPAPPPNIVLTGHLTATVTGEQLASEAVDLAAHQTSTDTSGGFRFEFTPGTITATPLLTISGPNVVTRQSLINLTSSRDLSTDAIVLGGSFDLAFYRELVRDNHDSPGVMRLIRRWDTAPRIYLMTVDEAGSPIDAGTLDTVEAALRDSASSWTGGRFSLASLERGTDTHEGQTGWVTVKWPALADPNVCGRAQVAVNGGWIELDYKNDRCTGSCSRNSRIAPRVARHELGHVMGFWHTGNAQDLMYFGTWTDAQCNLAPTVRESLHASIAYARPTGNSDPDSDPLTSYLKVEAPQIVVN
jgi:hypothetical protein